MIDEALAEVRDLNTAEAVLTYVDRKLAVARSRRDPGLSGPMLDMLRWQLVNRVKLAEVQRLHLVVQDLIRQDVHYLNDLERLLHATIYEMQIEQQNTEDAARKIAIARGEKR